MAEFKIDRIRFRWTGPWQTSKQYIKDDIVSYGGKSFVCLNGHTSDPDFYIDYLNQTLPKWTQMTDGYQWVKDWTPGTYYKVNDIAKYGGQVYAAIVGHLSTAYTPPENSIAVTVTVQRDTGAYTDSGYAESATGSFFVNGSERNVVTLQKGSIYRFSQTDASNATFGSVEHPIAFSIYKDGVNLDTPLVDYYTDGITYYLDGEEVTDAGYLSGFAEASSREILFTVPDDAPDKIFYFDRTPGNTDKGSYFNIETPGAIGANDFGNWKLVATGNNWRFEWQPQVLYRLDDVVKYNGIVYRCTEEHTSSTSVSGLETDSPKWEVITRSDNWTGDWTPRTRYRKDDLVRYGATEYRCITGHVSANTDAEGLEEDSLLWEVLISGIEYRGHWQASATVAIDAVGSTNVGELEISSHAYTDGDLVQYTTDGDDATALTNDQYYYVSVINGDTISLHLRKNEALAGTNVLQAQGGTGAQVLIKKERYKKGDILRYGPTIWYCDTGHSASGVFAESFFTIWLPGYEYEELWTELEIYQPGDIVKYGGYSYTSLTINTNSVPSVNGITQDTGDWELLTQGYRMGGQYNQNPDLQAEASYWNTNTNYRTGDVVRFGGWLYHAVRDNSGNEPDDAKTTSTIAVTVGDPGSGNRYYLDGVLTGDVTLVEGNTYRFDQSDSSNLTHALYLSTSVDGHHDGGNYNYIENGVSYWLDGVQVADATAYDSGFAAATERYVQYLVPTDAYKANYVVCFNHSGMYGAGTLTTIYSNNYWVTLIDGDRFRGNWAETLLVNAVPVTNNYFLGDIVTYEGTLFRCIKRHTASQSDSRPDLDIEYIQDDYWQKVVQGGNTNVLQYRGDVRTYTDEATNLNIGNPGDTLKVMADDDLAWEALDQSENVFYVSPDGIDVDESGRGLTKTSPFKTVKFATTYIFEDEGLRTPATIIVATGRYEEICPISVPANVAIVGDELRSTTIAPTADTKDQDMFRVRNGCGIRNMTLTGLEGEFTDPDEYLLRRVTPGNAFVALDPGTGPDDQTVWITTKSTYVQNVSTFGKKCVGMKVDGDLHNGGNKSIVANDFTQIIQDGIGYWCNADGLSELVSVFTYYCYIGYLCTNGGKVRATNGNNSYGEYGSVAVGFDENETAITAKVDNYSKEATVSKVYNDENKLFAVGYSNTGVDYTSGTATVTGSGENATGRITEIRNGGVTEIRVLDPGDSSRAGGANYTYANNRAQQGGQTVIRIANQDVNNEDYYSQKQITIVEGEGRGQYAYIDSYDWLNGGVLNTQVTSAQDPVLTAGTYTGIVGASSRVDAQEPTFTVVINDSGDTSVTVTGLGKGNQEGDVITIAASLIGGTGNNVTVEILAVTAGTKDIEVKRPVDNQPGWQHYLPGEPIATVLDETTRYEITPRLTFTAPPYTQSNSNIPAGQVKDTEHRIVGSDNVTVIVGTNQIARSTDGATFADASSYTDLNYVSVAKTQNGFIVMDGNGRLKTSTDGDSWGDTTNNLLSYGLTFKRIAYGTDYEGVHCNIAIAGGTQNIYKSTDGGNTWSQVNAGVSNAEWIAFGNQKWIVVNEAGDTWESVDNGVSWNAGNNIGDARYDVCDFVFGNGKFVASCFDSPNDLSTVNNKFIHSFTDSGTDATATQWIVGEDTGVADNIYINYSQGTFLGVTATGSLIQSDDGVFWTQQTTASGSFVGMGYGVTDDGPVFYPYTSGTVSSIERIQTGATTRATALIASGRIQEFIIQEAGSGYGSNPPTMSIIDPDATEAVNVDIRMRNGCVGQIEFFNRGTGYINIKVEISGDGYADLFQLQTKLVVKELLREPGPGDNLYIAGINDRFYSVQGVADLVGTDGNYQATLTISPGLDRAESPEHETNLTIRQKYSQVRLTGHDFLEIGKGNLYSSQYPLLTPIEGYDVRDFQETEDAGGGRVFYTSTDQDGNFRVGELFKVEQATGIVSLNASYFELDGLSELRLGGVTLGGTNAVIREFSTDATFAANSNEIVPTQKAIAGYVDSRISGGGTNVNVNAVIAGEVRIQGRKISSEANRSININTQMNFQKPVDGDMAAMAFFTGAANFGLVDEGDPTSPQEMGQGK